MGYFIRQASAGIGLVSETVKAQKAKHHEKKQKEKQQQHAEGESLSPVEETESLAPSYHTEDGGHARPSMQNGRPSMQNNSPPSPLESNYPPSHNTYPPTYNDRPPMQNNYPPPMNNGYSPPMGNNYPPAQNSHPPMHNNYRPPMEGNCSPNYNTYPPAQNGQPPMHGGQPPMYNGHPPMENNYPPQNSYPPPMGDNYHPIPNGQPPIQNNYPPMENNHPPTYTAYHPWEHGQPPMQNTYPPTENNYPPQSSYPPTGNNYPPTHNEYPPPQTSREVSDSPNPTEKSPSPKDEKPTTKVHEYDQDSVYSRDYDEVDKDIERQWELDEAQDHLRGVTYPTTPPPDQDDADYSMKLAESFVREYPVPLNWSYYDTSVEFGPPKLDYPVVLPQRRPKDRQRGFVRAYAPELEKFGIDQKMFLDYVDKANKSCIGSQWFQVINLANNVGGYFVSPTVGFVMGIVADAVVRIGMAVDGRRRSGNFFDKINQDFFMPRGLFCLLMTYAPESKEAILDLDMNNTITSARTPEKGFHRVKQKYQTANATANSTFDQFSPLIFPDLHNPDVDEATKKKYEVLLGKVHRAMEGVEEYYDKRDQAKFIAKNPESNLAMGRKPEFTSRYADPTNKAASGSLLAMATGGKFTDDTILGWMGIEGRSARGAKPSFFGGLADAALKKARGGDKEAEKARAEGKPVPHQSTKGFVGGGLNKLLKRKVIYMMIVNMPSEEEMRRAREIID
ncbi:hypothetical protein BO79DRAFT_260052 [Aspergillus costaricaensis CBS 115574]|uniref:Uncharacterized protein n=1 Tax=Aspergillus costaricaensis CBS 115574 TaxID=1448317 RepID=A0ACD1I054_9EURO|nr:hypothetical protein BO79DRAFT_260052 [Aspergillus costaricaensis CBS 115574]RAK83609.1 hypothetical protein BO79DRAFT_260052 [Aspergillus costaricaensis CBS 115574]